MPYKESRNLLDEIGNRFRKKVEKKDSRIKVHHYLHDTYFREHRQAGKNNINASETVLICTAMLLTYPMPVSC
jgi:hypothetical protein